MEPFQLQPNIHIDGMIVNIFECADRVKQLYRNFDENPDHWETALRDLEFSLSETSDSVVLERCILDDGNWELPVDERILILRKARAQGAASDEFLMDYYGFLSAHLDPGIEKDEADRSLAAILK